MLVPVKICHWAEMAFDCQLRIPVASLVVLQPLMHGTPVRVCEDVADFVQENGTEISMLVADQRTKRWLYRPGSSLISYPQSDCEVKTTAHQNQILMKSICAPDAPSNRAHRILVVLNNTLKSNVDVTIVKQHHVACLSLIFLWPVLIQIFLYVHQGADFPNSDVLILTSTSQIACILSYSGRNTQVFDWVKMA